MDARGYAVYRSLDSSKLPMLHLAYAIDPSDSGRKHATVKQRWLNGDPEVHAAALTWASLVDQLIERMDRCARGAAELKDVHARLGELMNQNFDLRRRLYGDASLGWKNLRMIEIARAHGGSAKFPGSGGAILIYCDPHAVNTWKLKKAMYAEGFVLVSLHYLAEHQQEQ
jgi:glucuronokinase